MIKNLAVVTYNNAVAPDTLFIRSRADGDGDFMIEVSRDNFKHSKELGYFSISAGKLRFYPYSDMQDYADVLHLNAHTEIEVS